MAQLGPILAPSWLQKIAFRVGGVAFLHISTICVLRHPRWPQDGPKMAQDGPKLAPRWSQDGPKTAQDDPKMAPRWSQGGPKVAPRGPKMLYDGLNWAKTQDAPQQQKKRFPIRSLMILGPILTPAWDLLGPPWATLGPSWGHLGASGGFLGHFWAIFSPA